MKTITTKVYTYDELSDKAKEKALDNNRLFNTDNDFWPVCVIEDRTAILEEHGFYEPQILYSGFCSQGDGACFTATLDNGGLLSFLTKTKQLAKYKTLVKAINDCTIYVNIKITHTDRYYHENSTTIEDWTESQANEELTGKLLEEYTQWYSSFDSRASNNASIGWYYEECQDIYRHLETEHDYQNSDEIIEESLLANEMQFLEDGTNY